MVKWWKSFWTFLASQSFAMLIQTLALIMYCSETVEGETIEDSYY